MIKHIAILIITITSCQTILAQEFDFYALAGPTVNQIDGDRIGGFDKMGAVAGVGVARSLSPQWQALMELEYMSKGAASYVESSGATYKTALHYIQLPLLAEYKIAQRVYIESGLSFGFLLSYQFYEDNEPSSSEPFKPLKFELGWLLGGSYAIDENWKINLRFSYSIVHMNEITETGYYRPNIWKHPLGKYNRSLALAVQYWF